MPTIHPDNPDSLQPTKELRRSRGEDAFPAPGHNMDHVPADFRQVNGWGADLDPANRPSFPKELPSDVKWVRGEVGARQELRETIFVSNEHPDLTPVFGTACPPKGLSGMLRSYAYEYGENANRHWLTLMLADRVDIWEHLITDALAGRPDNWPREKGWPARLRERSDNALQRKYLMMGAAALGALALGVVVRNVMQNRSGD